MRHVVKYVGQAQRISVNNITFDRDVPTPVDLAQHSKLDVSAFADYKPGDPCTKGRPILIRVMHYTRTVLWSRQFVEIVKARYPSCPIVIHGLQSPGFERVFEGIAGVSFLHNPSHKELKKIDPYRTFDLTYGDMARMGRRPLTLIAGSYGAQTAIALNIIYGFDGWENEIPRAYPIVGPLSGDYVAVVEYGPDRERSWEALRDAVVASLTESGVAFKTIRVGNPETFEQDWETIRGSFYTVICGESDLVYVAALLGKRGVFASRGDHQGWMLRGQLKGSWFPENGIIEIEDGTPPKVWADRITRKIQRLIGIDVVEPPSQTVLLNPTTGGINAPADDLAGNRTRNTRKSRKNRIRQS